MTIQQSKIANQSLYYYAIIQQSRKMLKFACRMRATLWLSTKSCQRPSWSFNSSKEPAQIGVVWRTTTEGRNIQTINIIIKRIRNTHQKWKKTHPDSCYMTIPCNTLESARVCWPYLGTRACLYSIWNWTWLHIWLKFQFLMYVYT